MNLKQSLGNGAVNMTSQLVVQSIMDLMDTLGGGNPIEQYKGKLSGSTMPVLAYGGVTNTNRVNAEGGEVVNLPNNLTGFNLEGPSHAEGGIDMNLPKGTAIFSDRLKLEGKTFADRKKIRDNKLKKSEKAVHSYDKTSQFTRDRMAESMKSKDQDDLLIQSLMAYKKTSKKGGRMVAKYGLNPFDPNRWMSSQGPSVNVPPLAEKDFSNVFKKLTPYSGKPNPWQGQGIVNKGENYSTGKVDSFFDTLFNTEMSQNQRGAMAQQLGSLAPAFTTLANRAGDTPNINPYADYGREALTSMNQSRASMAAGMNVNKDMLSSQAATSRAALTRGSSSINQARNLNVANDMQFIRGLSQVTAQNQGQLAQVDNQIAQATIQAEGMRAQGRQAQDMADRQDRDAFYTNFGTDLQTAFDGQKIGARDQNNIALQTEIRTILDAIAQGMLTEQDALIRIKQLYSAAGIQMPQTATKK